MQTKILRGFPIVIMAVLASACAGTTRPPESGAPGSSDQTYPIVYQAAPERVDEVRGAWTSLLKNQSDAPRTLPELQPVTLTIKDLPPTPSGVLRLQHLGTGPEMTRDDVRESLRRFLDNTKSLTGVDPAQLSLIDQSSASNSNDVATYEQSPFRYPIRNGFGVVRIGFSPDLRVSQLTSTCLPNLQGVQRNLSRLKTTINAEQAASIVQTSTLQYSDTAGSHQLSVTPSTPVNATQLVLFPILSPDKTSIALHLAWEVTIGNSNNVQAAYVDAVDSQILGTA